MYVKFGVTMKGLPDNELSVEPTVLPVTGVEISEFLRSPSASVGEHSSLVW